MNGEGEKKRLSLRKIKSSDNKGDCAKEKAAKASFMEDGDGARQSLRKRQSRRTVERKG